MTDVFGFNKIYEYDIDMYIVEEIVSDYDCFKAK